MEEQKENKFCKHCGKEINDSAVLCDGCGAKQENKPPKETEDKPKTNKKVVSSILSVIFALIIIVAISEPGHTNKEAWTSAQIAVENNLKSPSNTKYPWGYDEYVTKINDDTFKVKAYVDSENSFGATVRTNFSCTVEFTGEDTYIVKDLQFWE